VGGLSTTVADGVSGLLVDGHDPATWAAAINRVLTDEDLYVQLSAGALHHAEKFSWKNTANKLIKTYEEVI
jgi:D-inositol-3-phosphate glycosyltransferase